MASKWTTVSIANAPSGFVAGTMLLLTDGSVMIHGDTSANWMRLTPGTDPTQGGDVYAHGAFAQTQAMASIREYFASGVVSDGRMYVIGAEYSDTSGKPKSRKDGQVYDPQTDSWTAISKPSPQFDYVKGDVGSVVLPDGRVLLGGDGGTQAAVWDPTDDSWVNAGTEFGTVGNTKQGGIDEETWTLLPDGSVLTVEISSTGNAEKYLPATDQWVSAGTAKQTLALMSFGNPAVNVSEIGPALALPNGKALAIGATGATGIYTPNADPTKPGTWAKGPSLGVDGSNNPVTAIDAPAVLTPGGRVICAGGSTTVAGTNSSGQPNAYFSKPTTLFEWDPASSVTTMPTLSSQPPATGEWTYQARFLVLPTGQIAMTVNDGNLYLYTPDVTDGTPDPSWAPVITGFPSAMIVGHSYPITGQRLNGLSSGASYGDDAQMSTSYPIVRVKEHATGKIRYLRSYAFSTMGIAKAGDTSTGSCQVQVPSDLDEGAYDMVVIANGIPSASVVVQVGTRDCFITLERDTYSQGDVNGMIKQAGGGAAVYSPALFVVVEGFKPSELGISGPADLASPGVIPGVTVSDPSMTAAFAGPVKPEDRSLPDAPQRFTYPFKLSFADASAFNFGGAEEPITLIAQLNAAGSAVSGVGVIELLKSPDPIILHGDQAAGFPWYLSVDLRVVQLKVGDSRFGTSVPSSGSSPAAATAFIQKALDNLNGVGTSSGTEAAARADFNAIAQAEDLSELTLAPADGSGHAYYNFALARVRLRDTVLDAKNVALFFRLWPAQQTNAAYHQQTTYRRGTNAQGETIPLLGVNGDEIVSIPFFAEPRVGSGQALTAQRDRHNRHATIAHDPSGAEVDTYFGCWLDINQPNDTHFPQRILGVGPDGPFNTVSPLFPIQQLVRSNHCCLIAEIEIDGQPQLISSSADPSTSDKLAQRNLTFVGIPNPGVLASRRAPQPFELKPSVSVLPVGPGFDELMIDFGTVPPGTTAEIFLPAASADDVLTLASERYLTHRLTRIDAYTIGMPTNGLGWLPIPAGVGGNLAGLLTLDFPATVKKGTIHTVVVRQVSTVGRGSERGGLDGVEMAAQNLRSWRRVIGSFAIAIPVTTQAELLPGEERKLSIMRWIGEAIPTESRWYRVFGRYLDQLTAKVGALGGDPSRIPATGTGTWRDHGDHGGHDHGDADDRARAGKVIALCYDRFGDFEGFVIETFEGRDRRFFSREQRIELLARRAWIDRLRVLVFTEGDNERVAGLELRGSPFSPDC